MRREGVRVIFELVEEIGKQPVLQTFCKLFSARMIRMPTNCKQPDLAKPKNHRTFATDLINQRLKMKKKLFLSALLLATLSAGAQQAKYTIKGVSNQNGKRVYLTDCITWNVIDSTYVKNNKFSLKGQADKDAYLVIEPQGDRKTVWRMFFFNDGTPITVNMNDSTLKGSPLNERVTAYKLALDSADRKHDFMASLGILNDIFSKERESLVPAAFVTDYKKKFVVESFNETMSQDVAFTRHPYVKDFMEKQKRQTLFVVKRDRSKDAEKEAKKKSVVGEQYKDFEMADPDGKMHKLSEYVGKGHWLLVDFWASWCYPCRTEMPNVVAAYKQYHAKGLDIVGISFDREKEAWTKGINDLEMPWPHLSQLVQKDTLIKELYQVNSIPDNLLIDPQGKIVARNLRGEALQAKLKEIFGE